MEYLSSLSHSSSTWPTPVSAADNLANLITWWCLGLCQELLYKIWKSQECSLFLIQQQRQIETLCRSTVLLTLLIQLAKLRVGFHPESKTISTSHVWQHTHIPTCTKETLSSQLRQFFWSKQLSRSRTRCTNTVNSSSKETFHAVT